ncbi:nucleoid-associated protein NdpA [Catenovulum agarivorans DS-2]|uniref:Nucleoid-associated protein NdpA n=1 Tax=Catenovulum agarivorans DS-2 TaxID=1328313 RepID=W7Q970_9ALTE|nr:nucleoid-associated protein [Catenovulum agarivorans]EWH08551.1 nucleoid-associated protein NdpA [Catenovulum agarivorans DS-2]
MAVSKATLYFNRYRLKDDQLSLQLENCTQVGGDNADFLAGEIHQSFTKKGQKQYCSFAEDSAVFAQIKAGEDMQQIADNVAQRMLDGLTPETLPAETILVIAHYQHLATQYILATMLGVKESVQLSEAINPQRSQYLDIANISLAVQIDLSELSINPDSPRSIGYIKGRVGRKIGDFMAEAFAIEEKMNAKEATQKLVESVEKFIEDNSTDTEKSQAIRDVSVEAMKTAAQSGEFMQVKNLSQEIEEKTGIAGFYDMAAQAEDFSEECPVYASATKGMQKFFGQGGGISISFERELLGEKVQFDPQAQTLTFHKIPPNLLDALQKAMKAK